MLAHKVQTPAPLGRSNSRHSGIHLSPPQGVDASRPSHAGTSRQNTHAAPHRGVPPRPNVRAELPSGVGGQRHHQQIPGSAVGPRPASRKGVVMHVPCDGPAQPPHVAKGTVETKHTVQVQTLQATGCQREIITQHLSPAPRLGLQLLTPWIIQFVVVKYSLSRLISAASLEIISPFQTYWTSNINLFGSWSHANNQEKGHSDTT